MPTARVWDFGGPNGSHVLVRELKMPVVTTLHTLLCEPTVENKGLALFPRKIKGSLAA